MKSLIAGFIAAITLTFSATLFAGPYGHGHRYHEHHNHFHNRHWHHSHSWVVPALIGSAVVYAATRPDPIIVQPAPVIVQPNQVVIDGIIYNRQIMIVNGVQQEVLVRTQ
ncbi:MAG: hypothetical protein EBU90_07865 [Proteobacteria bacterium]|nr:hypothetical protein [Pseudomonadota bacterium]NBP14115.1 hypothetical protein [bacterium]